MVQILTHLVDGIAIKAQSQQQPWRGASGDVGHYRPPCRGSEHDTTRDDPPQRSAGRISNQNGPPHQGEGRGGGPQAHQNHVDGLALGGMFGFGSNVGHENLPVPARDMRRGIQ